LTALRIEAPSFVAGVIVGFAAAPIVGYMRPWSYERIFRYCFRRRWKVREVAILCAFT
jgi:hypothetical protein